MLRAPSPFLSQLPDLPAPHGAASAARTIFTQRTNAVVPLHWLSTAAAFPARVDWSAAMTWQS